MTENEYNGTLRKDNLSISEKVGVFNYYIKNKANAMIVYEPTSQFSANYKGRSVKLKNCTIKEPKTKEGLRILDYSISQIRK